MNDLVEQAVGPIAMAQIDGLSQCQHRIFGGIVAAKRSSITLRELHELSNRQADFAAFEHDVAVVLGRRGIQLSPVSLTARLHRVGLDALSRLRRLSRFATSVEQQLAHLVEALSNGQIEGDEQFAQARLLLTLP